LPLHEYAAFASPRNAAFASARNAAFASARNAAFASTKRCLPTKVVIPSDQRESRNLQLLFVSIGFRLNEETTSSSKREPPKPNGLTARVHLNHCQSLREKLPPNPLIPQRKNSPDFCRQLCPPGAQ